MKYVYKPPPPPEPHFNVVVSAEGRIYVEAILEQPTELDKLVRALGVYRQFLTEIDASQAQG